MNKIKNSILKAVSILTLFTIITRAIGFLFKIYLSNILTPNELGIYTVTVSIYMLLLSIVSSGLPITISKKISQNNISNNDKTNYVSNGIILSTILAILIISFVIIFRPIFMVIFADNMSYIILLYLLPSILFMALYSPIMGYFWGNNDYFNVSLVEFVEQIIRIGLSTLLIILNPFNNYLISTCLGLTIACGISTIYGIILYRYKKGKFCFTIKYSKSIIKSTLPIILMRVASSIMQPILNIVVPICLIGVGYTNAESLALIGIIYGMCMPIITIPSTITGSINMALLPDISYNADNPKILTNKIKSNFKLIIICEFILLPIFLILSEPICNILYGNSNVSYYLFSSIWLIVPMGISQYFSSIMNALGKENKNFIYSILASIFMMIFILFTSRMLEIYALILGLGMNSIISSVLNFLSIKKTIGSNFNPLSDIITNIIFIFPIILIDYFIYNILRLVLIDILLILVISSISIILYLILVITFQYIDINYIHKLAKA